MDGVDQRLVETCHANLPTRSSPRFWTTSQPRAALTWSQQGSGRGGGGRVGGYEPERGPPLENLFVYNSTLTKQTARGMMTKHMKRIKQTHQRGFISQQDGLREKAGTMAKQVFIPGVATGRYKLLFISSGSHIICYFNNICICKSLMCCYKKVQIITWGWHSDIFSCNRFKAWLLHLNQRVALMWMWTKCWVDLQSVK